MEAPIKEEYRVFIYSDGDIYHTLDGMNHCATGPAIIIKNKYKSWYLNGKRHREDGPAMVYLDGSKYWFLDGEEFTEKNYDRKIKEDVDAS